MLRGRALAEEHLRLDRRITPTLLAQAMEVSRQRAHQLLGRLVEKGKARCLTGGVYEYVHEDEREQR